MSTYAIWLDQKEAKVFKMTPEKVDHFHINFKANDHHTHAKNQKGDEGHHHEQFYHEVAIKIKDADRIMIMGPGMTKNHFKNHLESHDKSLAKKIVAFQTVDHPTDKQLVAIAKELLGKEILWKGLST